MKLLLKKHSQGSGQKNKNTVEITKSVISIRENVIESLGLNRKSSGSIGYGEDGSLCLFTKSTPYPKFYKLTTNAKPMDELRYLYINISEANRVEMKPLIGTYVIKKTTPIENGIMECKLKKMY